MSVRLQNAITEPLDLVAALLRREPRAQRRDSLVAAEIRGCDESDRLRRHADEIEVVPESRPRTPTAQSVVPAATAAAAAACERASRS